ncbi:MAG: RidA family protein [Oscillatoriales cyanobacterium RM2_1_1]|nr:RidA family protein [Oscillatoriales cyanobacterium SM2_3_0]NJO45860.1 RidA family protein [Oscillatoriales cyanobacterium RM2_1_1]
MSALRIGSDSPWETRVGYCRAIRVGNQVFVSGTAPITDSGEIFAPGDGYAQAQRCFEIIGQSLRDLGADLTDVVRTRMFVTNIDSWAEFGRAHSEVFRNHPPATTMVEVQRLIDPAMLIEIEADTMIDATLGETF